MAELLGSRLWGLLNRNLPGGYMSRSSLSNSTLLICNGSINHSIYTHLYTLLLLAR
jgi:hypothetical protein